MVHLLLGFWVSIEPYTVVAVDFSGIECVLMLVDSLSSAPTVYLPINGDIEIKS